VLPQWLCGLVLLAACGKSGDADPREASGRIAEVQAPITRDRAQAATGRAGATDGDEGPAGLARAAGGADGTQYRVRVAAAAASIEGHITGGAPRDTSIVPTHDLGVCEPFSEALVPSREGGVGLTLVWLEGVREGPRDTTARRVSLSLDGCRLAPRLMLLGVGGTLLVRSGDAMLSRLQFTRAGTRAHVATVSFSDAGQIVPVSEPGAAPGVLAVTDDLHPWVRAWVVVTPHPFVAITGPDGRFRFDGVPAGRYRLVAWHEHLGTRAMAVRVDAGVIARVDLHF